MNIQESSSGSVVIADRHKISIDGKEIPNPPHYNSNNMSMAQINGALYINGYKWIPEKKKWKRAFMALWHWIF